MCTKTCVAYMRYSSDNQRETSIDYQRAAITDYCKKNGLTLKLEFVDEAFSATTDKRPDFQKMIEASKNRPEWDTILVYDLSRIFRNAKDATLYKNELLDRGIKVVSVTEPLVSSENNSLMEGIIDLMNAQYSKDNSKRTHAGMTVKAAKGGHCGGIPPLGYSVDSEGRYYVDEEEAETVRKIFQLYLEGYSCNKMASILNGTGLRTKAGKPFTKNSFHHILTQEKYIGIYRWNKRRAKNSKGQYNNHAYKPVEQQTVIQDGCPTIVSKEVFEAVKQKLSERAHGKAESKSRRHYMLGGMKLMKCANCGAWMVGKVTTSHGKKYITYACPKHKGGRCSTKDIKATPLERYVAATIVTELVKKSNLPELNRLLQMNGDNKQIQQLENRRRGVEKKIGNVVKGIEAAGPSEALVASLQQLEQEKKALESQLTTQNKPAPTIKAGQLKRLQKDLVNEISKNDSPEIRNVLHTYIKEISVGNDTVTVDFNF